MTAQKVWNGTSWETIGGGGTIPPPGGGEGSGIPHPPNDTPDPYVRPADWMTMPTVNVGDQKVCVLTAVWDHDSNFVGVLCAGAYTVDWGDGTAPENFASNVQANHVYAYSAVGNLSSRGYRQAIMTITPQGAGNLTSVDISRHATVTGFPTDGQWKTPWLDLKLAGDKIASLTVIGSASNRLPSLLERLEYVGPSALPSFSAYNCSSLQEVVGTEWTVNMASITFANCSMLQALPALNLPNLTSCSSMFYNCFALRTVPPLDTSKVTSFQTMFNACRSLRSAPELDTTAAAPAAFTGTFTGCALLETVPAYDTSRMTTMSSTFNGCASLREVPLLNTHSVIDFSNMFFGCTLLEKIPLFDTAAGTTFTSMFQGCLSLRETPLFNLSKSVNLTAMFQGCSRIETVPAFSMPLATTFTTMFNGCTLLKRVGALDTRAGAAFNSMFLNCTALESVALFDTSKGVVNGMFSGCVSLRGIPPFDFSGSSTLYQTFFGCSVLQSLPPLDTRLGTTFVGMVSGCSLLTSMPPLDTSKGTNFGSMFATCANLRVVPALDVSLVTTTANLNQLVAASYMMGRSLVYGAKVSHSYTTCFLGPAALNEIYTNLASGVTAQTVTVTTNWGTTADTPSIATAKGWTVTGS